MAEDSKALPAGWIRVESRSRPGEFVYENINTEERQAWFPTEAAVEVSAAAEAGTGDAAKAALQAKNKAALAKRKAAAAAEKDAKSKLPLPTGWTRVASTSRPGETVYQNEHTGDKQAWFPDAPAMPAGATPEETAKEAMKDKNKAALAKRKAALAAKKSEDDGKALPAGWIRVESRSRPGEFVYENTYTDERQAWFPDGPASKPLPDGWNKVESRTYPGEFVFENKHTGERQAWEPTEAAAKILDPNVEKLFRMMDTDKGGTVSKTEFLEFLREHKPKSGRWKSTTTLQEGFGLQKKDAINLDAFRVGLQRCRGLKPTDFVGVSF